MKPRLHYVVPGPPVPCARARVVPLMGRGGRAVLANGRPVLKAFTPEATAEYEERVARFSRAALQACPGWALLPSTTRFRVTLHFVRNVRRGDADNFAKGCLDGIKKANVYRADPTDRTPAGKPREKFVSGIFRDDAAVEQLIVTVETNPKEQPHTEVLITTAGPPLEEPLWQQIAKEHGWSANTITKKHEGATT